MDTTGSVTDPTIRIKPALKLREFINDLKVTEDIPPSVRSFKDTEVNTQKINNCILKSTEHKSFLNSKDIETLKSLLQNGDVKSLAREDTIEERSNINEENSENENKNYAKYLLISDVEWLSGCLERLRNEGEFIYLHELLEGSEIVLPENEIIKRNPILEARCVKLRRDQSNRDYRAMTKNVDNVRVRYPEDTIANQLKGINRQLVAILQFVITVGAGFLFGFLGIELMIGNLDFGFRLLLGVMCALIIALAEIYFLAKRLNEELTISESVQLGGPSIYPDAKQHQD